VPWKELTFRDARRWSPGIANDQSLAWWAAKHFRGAGADLAITYVNDRAKPYVEPLAKELDAKFLLKCDVEAEGKLEAVFKTLRNYWGRIDIVFHAVAWARKEDLHGRLTDGSPDRFAESMLISCHSFIRMARLSEPLMQGGGS
jgi:enoyl-[acyl-carrier protein] reductase I